MKIAISTNGNTLESQVAEEFEKSTYLIIVDVDDFSIEVFENDPQRSGSGLEMVRIIKEFDCEALITGSIERVAFEPLVEEQITRYLGVGFTAKEALTMMEKYRLEIIRDYKGSLGILHKHPHGGSCDCNES